MTAPATASWRGQTTCVAQTRALGAAVAAVARCGDLIALIGELGAGKTQFVKGLAPGEVSSPTFVLVHEHELGPGGPRGEHDQPVLLRHVDAYRLDTAADLESIGWDTDFADQAVVVVEWADRLARVPGALGPDRLEVELSHGGEAERLIECRACGHWCLRMEQLRRAFDHVMASVNA